MHDLEGYDLEELVAAGRHLEDLEIFVGQRSRLHPGAGWAATLAVLRSDLAEVQAALAQRGPAARSTVGGARHAG